MLNQPHALSQGADQRPRTREVARLHKILEDTGIKLGCVATDILGKSGRDMLDALVTGTTDPEVLAELARGQLRQKIPALKEALEGRFDAEHALIVSQILAHIDFLDEAIDRLSAEIEERIAPFARQRDLLMTIPGVKQRTAEVLIAEIGVDMTAFPTPKHLASWAGVCPGNNRVRRQTPFRQDPQRLEVAQSDARGSVDSPRTQDQGLLPRRPIPAPTRTPRPTPKPSPPSDTRSSPPPGTCSKPASYTTTSAATTSPARTPTAPPDAWSDNSKRSDTASRSSLGRLPPDGISLQGRTELRGSRQSCKARLLLPRCLAIPASGAERGVSRRPSRSASFGSRMENDPRLSTLFRP